MKKSFILCLISFLAMSSAQAADCGSLPKRMLALTSKIHSYNYVLRKNYESRLEFTADLYKELAVNEGRTLYIPYGTYDSVKRSIYKEKYNTNDVKQTTFAHDVELGLLVSELHSCL